MKGEGDYRRARRGLLSEPEGRETWPDGAVETQTREGRETRLDGAVKLKPGAMENQLRSFA